MSMNQEIKVTVDRDSVCAGDDCDSHLESFSASASTTISEFLHMIQVAHFLAAIQGGNATWLIDCLAEHEQRCIGVVAQQWSIPQLLVAPETLLIKLLPGSAPRLYFRYWAQADPDVVLACLQSGQPLPDRHS